jgi:hypothetical protein
MALAKFRSQFVSTLPTHAKPSQLLAYTPPPLGEPMQSRMLSTELGSVICDSIGKWIENQI